MLTTSEQVNEIAAALCKVQAAVAGVTKDAKADAGKRQYHYATLLATVDAVRQPCTTAGVALLQAPATSPDAVSVETRLIHTSGQWVACTVTAGCNTADAQAVGSAITYLRRYGLMSLLGLAPEDDDGQAARGAPTAQPQPQRQPPSDQAMRERLFAACQKHGQAVPNSSSTWTAAQCTAYAEQQGWTK